MKPVATFGEDLQMIHLWYCVLYKYQLKRFIALQQRVTLAPPPLPSTTYTSLPNKENCILTVTLKEQEKSLRKPTVLQDRINYTPASFQDVGKQFIRSHCPLFTLFITNHVAGHSVTERALAYQEAELRVARRLTLLSETADAASC
jgi:hypothetical protein